MKMYERLIPEPVTLEDFADHFKRNVGEIDSVEHMKLFAGYVEGKFKLREISKFLGIKDFTRIFYYKTKHHEHLETDEIYQRKFNQL